MNPEWTSLIAAWPIPVALFLGAVALRSRRQRSIEAKARAKASQRDRPSAR